MSERPEQGHADARGGQNRCAEDLDPEPELPLQVLPVVDQAHDHDDRGKDEDLQQLAGPAEEPAGSDMLGHRPGKLGAAQQNGQTAGPQHDHRRQPDGHTSTQRHGRLVALVPARPVQKSEPQRVPACQGAETARSSTNAATASPSPVLTRTQSLPLDIIVASRGRRPGLGSSWFRPVPEADADAGDEQDQKQRQHQTDGHPFDGPVGRPACTVAHPRSRRR